jgi:hypothetical protein
MDKKDAETLIDALAHHSGIPVFDEEKFMNILEKTDVSESSRFYESLPLEQQTIYESDRYHYLSLRRILRNEEAKDYEYSGWKKGWEGLAKEFGIYSSTVLSRNLRAEPLLVSMMAESEHPFSLLGKLETYDTSKEHLYRITKPILVVPDTEDSFKITEWENKNSIYEKEEGVFFFRGFKRIKPEKYLAL